MFFYGSGRLGHVTFAQLLDTFLHVLFGVALRSKVIAHELENFPLVLVSNVADDVSSIVGLAEVLQKRHVLPPPGAGLVVHQELWLGRAIQGGSHEVHHGARVDDLRESLLGKR